MQDAWRAYLELALGATETSRKKAQKVARKLVGKSGATAAQLTAIAEEMVTTSAANREALVKLIRFEIDKALGRVGLATADEVAELNTRVRDLEVELRAEKARADAAEAAAAVPAPAKRAPAKKAPAKTATAPAKTATAPAKTAATPAKTAGAPVKKSVAKKTAVKKTAPPSAASIADDLDGDAPVATPAPAPTPAKKTAAAKTTTARKAAKKAPAKKAGGTS